jgi:hypothetical protein
LAEWRFAEHAGELWLAIEGVPELVRIFMKAMNVHYGKGQNNAISNLLVSHTLKAL